MEFDTALTELETVNKQLEDATRHRDILMEKLVAEFPKKYPTIYVQRCTSETGFPDFKISSNIIRYYLTKEEAEKSTPQGNIYHYNTTLSYEWCSYSSDDLPKNVIPHLIQSHQKKRGVQSSPAKL